ncbi:hypothetical protein Y032_0691g1568 [Ancylostoma ceylanicum]|uniref:Uncharacterized protein n=1 Tax=Ancylostoma ceylanicum TaxID=53326 RepID=A0A016WHS1_9BILA|nr:hypothetical protein Y032_0691g1568 [Ancylostoma ceylanicum]
MGYTLITVQHERSLNCVIRQVETLAAAPPSCWSPLLSCCSRLSPYSSSCQRMAAVEGRMAAAGKRCCEGLYSTHYAAYTAIPAHFYRSDIANS